MIWFAVFNNYLLLFTTSDIVFRYVDVRIYEAFYVEQFRQQLGQLQEY